MCPAPSGRGKNLALKSILNPAAASPGCCSPRALSSRTVLAVGTSPVMLPCSPQLHPPGMSHILGCEEEGEDISNTTLKGATTKRSKTPPKTSTSHVRKYLWLPPSHRGIHQCAPGSYKMNLSALKDQFELLQRMLLLWGNIISALLGPGNIHPMG